MHKKTLAELSQGLKNGSYSSVELTQHFLDRIQRNDTQLNSFITVTQSQAMAQANLADNQRQMGNATALTGIPLGHKDIFCTKDIKTTCGSKMLENFIAPYDACIIEKLNTAGTVSLGKTNMDEFAMGSSNENSFFGPCKNPWDTSRVPGGSSGGSASAVAARLVPAATGTDTGGSVRQPASFCGVTGFKPTYGRISRWGMIAFASSLDQAGSLTQTAEDAALLLNEMAGLDNRDSTSMDQPVEDYTAQLNNDLSGLTIGLPKELFAHKLEASVETLIDSAIKQYEKLGATIKEVSLPNSDLSVPAYYIIAPAECSSNLSRFDGVRYGYRCDDPVDLNDLYVRSRSEGLGEEVQRRILVGTYALSAGYYEAYYRKAQRVRRLIKNDFTEAFKEVDLMLSPTAPSTAFKVGEKTKDPIEMYLSDIYTIAISLAGLPAISIPVGFSQNLPVGLQLIGNYFCESRLLNAAHQYQKNTDWHQQIPEQYV
ncbi:MAG: Asp-tRNA(Asn)/Glu-tRNA(Gln) amidotransferase subunit GatA [Pseudomonadales bacterium]|nr:Asp-tRNA(Asn)/Glu-tRNA(Gln) amidotransferase subunit GatA [Pseudomonadales bacterium]